MHIGIVELCEKNHHSMIFNWIKIANENHWTITLFTTDEILQNVKSELKGLNYKVIIRKRSNFFFLIQINKIVKQKEIDKLIYLTICNYIFHIFVSFRLINLGVTVHNANTWFKKNSIRGLRHLLKIIILKKIKKDASFFIVNSKNMKKFIEESCFNKKEIYVLPFSLRKDNTGLNNKKYKKFTTVYPASINNERRRYYSFMKLALSNPNDKFIVLGETKKNHVDIKIFNELKKVPNIQIYNKYLDINEFNHVIKRSHLLFSDIKINYSSSLTTEIYGLSKDSGISYIMNEFNLPCMLNSDFSNFSELKSGSLYFANIKQMLRLYDKVRQNENYRLSLMKQLKKDSEVLSVEYYSNELKKSFS